MRVTEKLILENKKAKNRKRSPSEEEETLTYGVRSRGKYLNSADTDTYKSRMNRGINREENVFNRKATFHTRNKGEETGR